MSIAQLPQRPPRDPGSLALRSARHRLTHLVAQIDVDRLAATEALLEEIVAHQQSDTRSLAQAEVTALSRFGVTEQNLQATTALPATARGLMWEQEMSTQYVSVAEAAEMLRVTPTRVRQRCAAGTLVAQRHSEGWHLAAFQFIDRREPRGWATVARAIPRAAPLLLVERALTSSSPRLRVAGEDLAPLEWLMQGGDATAAAEAVADVLHRLP